MSKPDSTDSRGASPPRITASASLRSSPASPRDRPRSEGAHPEDARPIAPDGARDTEASTSDRWRRAEALDGIVERLERAAAQLRTGELDPDRAAAVVDECARLAADAGAQLDAEMRAADAGTAAPGQLRLA